MQDLPHRYRVNAVFQGDERIELTSTGLPELLTTSPAEFDGPGGLWSPETLLVGAVGDCLALTFRGVARASRLSWLSFACEATGTLDRVDRLLQFTAFDLHVTLRLPAGTDQSLARRVLDKAERTCLIANSLKATINLVPEIVVAPPVEERTGISLGERKVS